MRILHFADLHLGMENYGYIDPATGLNSRLVDFIQSFNAIIDYAVNEKIELVVFAGDAYKTREPSPTHENAFASGIQRLSAAGIPVVLVVGNHDLPNTKGKSDTLTIYDALDIPHVHVSSRPEILNVQSSTGAPVQIATLPWATKSHLLTKEEFAGKSIEDVNAALTEKLARIIDGHASEINPDIPSVLVSHVTASGATFGSEQNVMLGSDVVVPLGALANPKFNYVALGHLHKHQVLSKDPPVIYAGSCDRVDFGEEKEEKGFVVADIQPGKKTKWEFIPLPVRDFLTVEVTIKDTDTTPTDTIMRSIQKHDLAGKIVRLKLHIPQAANLLVNDKEIRNALSPAHFFAGTQRFVEIATRAQAREHEVTAEQNPLESLETYMKLKKVEPALAKKLKEHAEGLVQESRGT